MTVHKDMFAAERFQKEMLLVLCKGITLQGISGHYTYFLVRDIKSNSTVLYWEFLSEQIPATLGY